MLALKINAGAIASAFFTFMEETSLAPINIEGKKNSHEFSSYFLQYSGETSMSSRR